VAEEQGEGARVCFVEKKSKDRRGKAWDNVRSKNRGMSRVYCDSMVRFGVYARWTIDLQHK
jgi:hypothetical protein